MKRAEPGSEDGLGSSSQLGPVTQHVRGGNAVELRLWTLAMRLAPTMIGVGDAACEIWMTGREEGFAGTRAE